MPPDHPLVKYPVPVQAAGSANIGKVIAAVPGMNGKKSDLSYLPHMAGLPPPISAATSSLSYNELQDMYEPMVHKPYVPPEPVKPLTPMVCEHYDLVVRGILSTTNNAFVFDR